MKLGLGRGALSSAADRPSTGPVCLQCGMAAPSTTMTFCRRCGLPYGAPPRLEAELPCCPTCYATVGDDGLLPSFRPARGRIDLVEHIAEHDNHPVGDDDYLETLRRGDRIVIDRWEAPFDLVRRYLVTGAIDGGRRRDYQHSAIVTAMSQLKRWGPGADLFGDQAEWKVARDAVTALMERYHRR
jgi:hypothetical protein